MCFNSNLDEGMSESLSYLDWNSFLLNTLLFWKLNFSCIGCMELLNEMLMYRLLCIGVICVLTVNASSNWHQIHIAHGCAPVYPFTVSLPHLLLWLTIQDLQWHFDVFHSSCMISTVQLFCDDCCFIPWNTSVFQNFIIINVILLYPVQYGAQMVQMKPI